MTGEREGWLEPSPGDAYGDYLRLDAVLSAQAPKTKAHDELLFIIQHQTSELWMKLALHELDAAREAIAADRLQEAFKGLARLSRIFEQLNGAWDVLRTMTPADYTTFRAALGRGSGFQSRQYRLIEFRLGLRDAALIRPHEHDPAAVEALRAELARPSLYDVALAAAARLGAPLDPAALERDRAQAHASDEAVEAMWEAVYREPGRWWTLYELAEKLVDLEDYFRRWRFNHVTAVERVIGLKRGTGGTSGVGYLRRRLDAVLFPDLWRVRTRL
jgi:tryptophan 2,3-dioxygenase